jgi:hypothetical protein
MRRHGTDTQRDALVVMHIRDGGHADEHRLGHQPREGGDADASAESSVRRSGHMGATTLVAQERMHVSFAVKAAVAYDLRIGSARLTPFVAPGIAYHDNRNCLHDVRVSSETPGLSCAT